MNKLKSLLTTITFGLTIMLHTQSYSQPSEKLIIQAQKRHINQLSTELRNSSLNFFTADAIHPDFDYFIFSADDTEALYERLKNDSRIISIEWDREVKWRRRPNDPRITEQTYLQTIQAFQAWDITTGGKDYEGNEIVIAVVDEGFNIEHEDLSYNIFEFKNEIPGDGIDNDGNGTIDDKNGWNQDNNTGIHYSRSHGNNVLGVLGAEGDNNLGIAGINWNTKILPVTSGTRVSDVIASNLYVLKQKQDYIESGGTRGANICVLNYSAGLTGYFGIDFPSWCDTYHRMGQAGILCVVATANDGIDIDIEGDVPATCPSPYIMVVTSTGANDELDPDSGFGGMFVDVAAPGSRIMTTDLPIRGNYRTETGTSLSTPMVAGAAALFYTTDCMEFNNFIRENPAEAPLVIKQALMDGVDTKTSLTNRTVSGGRLNIFNALKIIYKDFCEEVITPPSKSMVINSLSRGNNNITLNYSTPFKDEHVLKIYNSIGQEIYSQSFIPPTSRIKIISADIPVLNEGLYYFASIISGKEVVSKGFTVY